MKFMALGGSTHIGASCYYAELAGTRVLLDLGRGFRSGMSYGPDFNSLLKSELLSLSQLDAVILSHGHFDHAAALPDFIATGSHVPIFSTPVTKALLDHLLLDRLCYYGTGGIDRRLLRQMHSREASERIQTVGYGRTFTIGRIEVTLYDAGHVPGAAMIFLNSAEGSILYTGDFTPRATALTAGAILPQNLKPDVTILCGTHAKHPDRVRGRYVPREAVSTGLIKTGAAYVVTSQLTKGLEITNYLSELFPDENLYLDKPILALAQRLEHAGVPALTSRCRPFPEKIGWSRQPPGIYIGGTGKSRMFREVVDWKLSLHADFEECVELLRKTGSETVFLVHSEKNVMGEMIFQSNIPWATVICPQEGHVFSDESQTGGNKSNE